MKPEGAAVLCVSSGLQLEFRQSTSDRLHRTTSKEVAQTFYRRDKTGMPSAVILPYTPLRTTAEDIAQITRCLHEQDPKVRLLAFASEITPIALAEPFSKRTITVTLNNNPPSPIFDFVPGPKFFARNSSKTRLVADVIAAGIPMPHSEHFSPEMDLDEARFGPYVAVKTTAPGTVRAKGIYVFRTKQFDELRPQLAKLYQSDIAKGHRPLVQQYIHTGPKPTHTRVSTFLGAPIVCFQTIAPAPFSPEKLTGLAGGEATSNFSNRRTRILSGDPEMVALAQEICAVFPETSVLSIDMVRCNDTGKAYCLEANLGNLCVLSAPICGGLLRDLGKTETHNQFGSYNVIARRIVETLDTL